MRQRRSRKPLLLSHLGGAAGGAAHTTANCGNPADDDFKSNDNLGNLFRLPLGPQFADNPFPQQAFKHDGGEIIFNLPNGLQGYLLVNGKDARPLGLAYWLVTDTGPKVALPGHPRYLAWLDETEAWRKVRERLRGWVLTLVGKIRGGEFPLKPRSEQCSQTCDFGHVCRISQSRAVVEKKAWQLPLPTV